MRVLFKARIPTEVGNAAAREGELGEMIAKILEDQKPEAAYFTDENGMRCAYLILEIESSSEIPKISEPWLLSFNAEIELHPAMSAEDLEKAGPWIAEAVDKYG